MRIISRSAKSKRAQTRPGFSTEQGLSPPASERKASPMRESEPATHTSGTRGVGGTRQRVADRRNDVDRHAGGHEPAGARPETPRADSRRRSAPRGACARARGPGCPARPCRAARRTRASSACRRSRRRATPRARARRPGCGRRRARATRRAAGAPRSGRASGRARAPRARPLAAPEHVRGRHRQQRVAGLIGAEQPQAAARPAGSPGPRSPPAGRRGRALAA